MSEAGVDPVAARERARYEAELRALPIHPLGVMRSGGTWPAPKYRFVLATCARWETRYLVEWLLYHRSIGIEHVYLYCNDDDPTEMYGTVCPFLDGPAPFVTFRHYGFQGLQYQMYFHFLRTSMHEAEWLMFLDIDEFICIRGSNSIAALFDVLPAQADACYFNWSMYGHAGHHVRPDGYVLLNYTRRTRLLNAFTKVFIRSREVPYPKIFINKTAPIHHDYKALAPDLVATNVLGETLDGYYDDFPSVANAFLAADARHERILATAYIAHFHQKSEQDFVLRLQRGLGGDFSAQALWAQKTDEQRHHYGQVTNEVEDTYLRDYWTAFLARGRTCSVFPPARSPLDTAGRPALQSSTAHDRSVEADAAAIVSGRLVGGSQNHTALEHDPWWQIDLEASHRIHEVRLFNRLDGVQERMVRFILLASPDAADWSAVLTRDDDRLFGGADGSPYVWTSEAGFLARYLRLVVPGRAYLHLDQIQFFGTAVP